MPLFCMKKLLACLGSPRKMRKQRKHLRRLPKDKRCSLRILVLADFSLGVIHKVLIIFGFNVHKFAFSVFLNEKIRPWDAAKHMESAAALAKELGNWNEVTDFYRRASELYMECGRPQPASDALAKAARALEDAMPEAAVQMYNDASAILEEDGKEQMAFDLYRAATSVYVKLEKYSDAASSLLQLGLAADKCNATNSQCKAYLGAIIVYLYAHDVKQAEKCYNDCSQYANFSDNDRVDAFLRSDQNRCASKLLSAYTEGDIEEIKRVVQSSTVSNLDHVVIKLARKLPTGDVSALKTDAGKEEEEPLDENDLT
ncbi:hypothetical protein POTOM_003303 [Populus tomentosa]|uniref:Gamma-soluble NSF attachment protein n=1 Tax=Populus tomentosa TaxID=118781 RepID=A0A8X8DLF0_POPTO|nr:hypothetical protein POTOM_003303 [Populus tomentosa]